MHDYDVHEVLHLYLNCDTFTTAYYTIKVLRETLKLN